MSPSDPYSDSNLNERTIIRPSPGKRRPTRPARPAANMDSNAIMESYAHLIDLEGDNPLLAGAFPLLALVPKLRSLALHDAPNLLQQQLISEIKRFEGHALKKGASHNQVEICKYLLCSILDETVLNTPWGSQSGWGHNSLSSLFFRKLVGGEEFFQILDRLKEHPEENQHLLEIAYLCLSLGFEGKYRYRNNGLLTLERERQDLYSLLQRFKGEARPDLSSRWKGLAEVQNPLVRFVPLWVLATVAGVMLLLVYMGVALTLRDRSDDLYDRLYTTAQNVEKAPPMELVRPVAVQKPTLSLEVLFKNLLDDEIAAGKVSINGDSVLRIFSMFSPGSADIRDSYQPLMAKIAQAVKQENIRLLVKGHTDDQRMKFSARFNSNWQLSTARAASAAKLLARYGFPERRISFEGMADNEPLVPNDTSANRAKNRRIDIHFR